MLDLRYVREKADTVSAALFRRGITIDLNEFLTLDAKRRTAQQEIETLRRRRNEVSEEIGRLKKAGQAAEDKVAEMRAEGDHNGTTEYFCGVGSGVQCKCDNSAPIRFFENNPEWTFS